jgi:competence protein ComEA
MKAKTRKIKQFFKEYFYFSQTERNGIIGLLIILVFLIALPSLYGFVFPPKPFLVTLQTISDSDSITEYNYSNSNSNTKFDPNTATTQQLKQLGFTDKNILTLQKYLAKGGRFKKPEDLQKMYGLKPELVARLLPLVVIENGFLTENNNALTDSAFAKKNYNKKPLELNTADTTALIALYRIGPSMAKRIVEYRDKLGGFLSLQQLTELYGFDEDILYDLQGKIYVDASKANIMNVNTVTIDELKTHPYFKYKLSNAIVNYRMQHGAYQSLTDLKKIVIVNDSIYQNIIQYLKLN